MSLFENMNENHEEEICGGNCPLCKLNRGEITQQQFDEIQRVLAPPQSGVKGERWTRLRRFHW
jgi:hypothetical protein